MTQTVGIYVFDDVELLDFAGPYEVFWTARRLHARQSPDQAPLFHVYLIAAEDRPVQGRGGVAIEPHYTLSDHPHLDVLIIPGGVVDAELARPGLEEWLRRTAAVAAYTASVCTGAFLLAQAGLLDGLPATTHWEDLPDLQQRYPAIQVRSGVRWVEAGHIFSAAGISAGLDMSLQLVTRLVGKELAERTARQMEYEWRR